MKLLITLLFLSLSLNTFCRDIDSLQQVLLKSTTLKEKRLLCDKISLSFYYQGNLDSAMYYNSIALNLVDKNNGGFPYGSGQIYITRILYLLGSNELEAAKLESIKLYGVLSLLSSWEKLLLGEYYTQILLIDNENAKALKLLYLLLEFSEYNEFECGTIYSKIGAVFYNLGNYEKAREYFTHSRDSPDSNPLSEQYNIIITYCLEDDFVKTLELLLVQISEEDELDYSNYYMFNLLGLVYEENNKLDACIRVLERSNKFMLENTFDYTAIMGNYGVLGKAFLGKYKETGKTHYLSRSKWYMNSALSEAKRLKHLKSEIDTYSNLVEIFMLYDMQDSALFAFNSYKAVHDSTYDIDKNAIIEGLEAKYETEGKQKEIAHLEIKNTRQALLYQTGRNGLISIISFSVLVVLFLLFLYYRSTNGKKRIVQALRIESLEKNELESLLKLKENELMEQINLLSEKNKLIQDFKIMSNKTNSKIDDIIAKFEQSYISDQEWDKIQLQFDSLYDGLLQKIKSAVEKITANDVRLIILLKLEYSNTSMCEILNISKEGVRKAKQRLRKKVDLESIF